MAAFDFAVDIILVGLKPGGLQGVGEVGAVGDGSGRAAGVVVAVVTGVGAHAGVEAFAVQPFAVTDEIGDELFISVPKPGGEGDYLAKRVAVVLGGVEGRQSAERGATHQCVGAI